MQAFCVFLDPAGQEQLQSRPLVSLKSTRLVGFLHHKIGILLDEAFLALFVSLVQYNKTSININMSETKPLVASNDDAEHMRRLKAYQP